MGKMGSIIDRIENNFKFHETSSGQGRRIGEIRSKAKDLALLIHKNAPDSREKSLALTELESCALWAKEAIIRNE